MACTQAPSPSPEPDPEPDPSPEPEPNPKPVSNPGAAPVLAAEPRLDLDANRARWHVHDRGLVIPIASEGLRKYDLAYKSPWGPVEVVGGAPGRRLKGKATLDLPWIDGAGAAHLRVRARGPGKLSATLDRTRLGSATLPAGWSEVTVAVPAGVLTAGEHRLVLDGARDLRWGEVELALDGAAACPPTVVDAWRRVSLYGELPATAHLLARPTGAARVRIATTDETGATTEVYAGPAAALPAALPLPATGDRMVRLDLEAVDGCARWAGAAIAVTAAPPRARPAPVEHVVLLVVDTLRADRLAAYGDTRVKTPRLTAAAARGAVFTRHQSMAPSSPPSHATLHTGQIPRVHGIAGDTGTLAADTPVLSAILAGAGLATTYAGDNDFAMGRFRKVGRWDRFAAPIFDGGGKDCDPIIAEALKAVAAAQRAGRRFFISLLPIEPHVPYRFHRGITEAYYPGRIGKPFGDRLTGAHLGRIASGSLAMDADRWAQLRALHDGEVERFDRCFGALEDGLAAAGVLDRTAIVLASDHGEGLGERGGKVGHAYSLHRELVATPLIVIGGVPAARVGVATSNLGVAATVLDLLGLPADRRMQGASLVPLTTAPAPLPRIVASEYGKSYALQASRWHLVVGYAGEASLHDVVREPDEAIDRRAEVPIALRALRDAAGLYLAHRKDWREATWGGLADLRPGSPLADPGLERAHVRGGVQSDR